MQTSHAPTQGQEGVRAARPAGEEQARRAKFSDELQWMMHAGSQLSAACEASSDEDEDMVARSSDIGFTLTRGSSVGTRSSSEEEAEDERLKKAHLTTFNSRIHSFFGEYTVFRRRIHKLNVGEYTVFTIGNPLRNLRIHSFGGEYTS